jgi:alpha-mannosidase
VAGVEVVDLLERRSPGGLINVEADGGIPVTLRPFQVLTLRLQRALP